MRFFFFVFLTPVFFSCGSDPQENFSKITDNMVVADSIVVKSPLFCNESVSVGAADLEGYLKDLEGQRVALVGNQSSLIGKTHLVDTLLNLGVNLVKVFSPEHGFRGEANAGEKVKDGLDPKTGLSVISLYGNNKKPAPTQLADVDVILFDIQDVGARFYTYISTLHYILEAAAENSKKVIILDRPSPNGHYVDGPVLRKEFSSFVGMHEIPVVHGMTVGEYAQMINQEGWLKNKVKADLKVVKCVGWDHGKFYELPVAPSPNLPTMLSVYLYPSLCFFEGTVVSIGRGTEIPFQCIGHPKYEVDNIEEVSELYLFTPSANSGSKHPKLEGVECYGYNLSEDDMKELRAKGQLDFSYLIQFYSALKMNDYFLENGFFSLLAGGNELERAIVRGDSEADIRESWEEDLTQFKLMRSKYLLYKDFE
jgi:uncharacterized protein YbbC (DUF1343 family)